MSETRTSSREAHLLMGAAAAFLGLFVVACGAEPTAEPGSGTPEVSVAPKERPPIDPELVRKEVEQHKSFRQQRKAVCPRRIPDRQEERRRYPAINILEGLRYVTISDDSSRGKYEKVIDLTSTGRQGLGRDLSEEMERYLITIARREYVPNSERFQKSPKHDDQMLVSFHWRWKPLNPLGERLNLEAPYSTRKEHQGRATYQRTSSGWKLLNLWLESDARDYMRGV